MGFRGELMNPRVNVYKKDVENGETRSDQMIYK